MSNSILQQYLNSQFISLAEDADIEKLKKTADQIEKKLRKDKHRLPQFALVAIDPNTPVSDPVLQEVQEMVIKNWPAFVNKAGGDNLVSYNRVIIMEALSSLATDAGLAGIIWLTVSQVIKHYSLGREAELLKGWLHAIASTYETAARRNWSVSDFKLEAKLPELPELKTYTVSRPNLTTRLSAAAGPTYINESGTNTSSEKGNQYWPNQNQHWTGQFGRVATEGIASAVDAVSKANSKEVGAFLSQYLNGLKPYLESLGQAVVNKSNSVDLRSQLLWVKESQFSVCMNTSYREIDAAILPFAIAKDIADIIPAIYPASVDFFAKEIARVTNDGMDKPVSIKDLLGIVQQQKDAVKPLLAAGSEGSGRQEMYQFITVLVNEQATIDSIQAMTGIPETASITPADLIVWLLHGRQVKQLISVK